MKKIYLVGSLLFFLLSMTACYEDDSTWGTETIPDIEIGKFRDTSIVSYNGNKLEVIPDVTTIHAAII